MKKILSVDSNLLNSKVVEQDVREYFNSLGEEVEFFTSQNPQETLDIINEHNIDIMFIDITSEHYNGILLLKHVKKQQIRQPKIVAVTILRDKHFRHEALKMNVYRYIYKPYDNKEIFDVLSKFFSKNYYYKKTNRIENFINVQDIDKSKQEDTKIVENESFVSFDEKMDAVEFLELYEEIGIDLDDLEDLDVVLERTFENILLYNTIDQDIMDDILEVLEEYNRFINQFTEFAELGKVIFSITILLKGLDLDNIPSESLVCKNIITIIQDLVDWKDSVFINEECENVYYINNAVLNGFVQLQDLIVD